MDYMLEVFEAKKDEFKDDPVIGPCVNSGWSRVDKYYSLISDSPAYTAALVLNPLPLSGSILKIHSQEIGYHRQGRLTSAQVPYSPTTATNNYFSQWKAGKHATRKSTPSGDEYGRYLRLPAHHDFDDARKWWLLPEQQHNYPNLSRMALGILSIPAMSTSMERLFSSANITVSDRRNHLTPDTIEIIESLKSWRKIKGAI